MRRKTKHLRSSTEKHWSDYWSLSSPAEQERQFNPVRLAHFESAMGGVSGKLILESGCGTALDTVELSKRGAIAVAYDYSNEALKVARRNAAQKQTPILEICGNILQMPFPSGTFDAVFHAGVLEHFRDPQESLLEQRRVLKPGGMLLVDVPQTYNFYTLYKAKKIRSNSWFAGWETQYSITGLESLMRSVGFEIVATYGYGYFPTLLAKARWASSIGKGFIGRPFMPTAIARRYDAAWERFEQSRSSRYCAQNIGVIGKAS